MNQVDIKFCKDCANYSEIDFVSLCYIKTNDVSLVTGEKVLKRYDPYVARRDHYLCGKEARWFKPKGTS